MILRKLLLFCLLASPLVAQSYQTSFVDIDQDRGKGSFSSSSLYHVDNATGALELNIPLGKGIGVGDLHFTPSFSGHIAEQYLYTRTADDTDHYSFEPCFMSCLPGHLDLKIGTAQDNVFHTALSNYELWDGTSGTLSGPITAAESQIDSGALLRAFGYPTTVAASMQPFGLNVTAAPFKKYTSSGDIFIAMDSRDPGASELYQLFDNHVMDTTPKHVLLIRGGLAYEFTALYAPGNTNYFYMWNRFRLTSIRNKFQERIDFVYAGGPSVMDYTAKLIRDGVDTGISIQVTTTVVHTGLLGLISAYVMNVQYSPTPSGSTGEGFTVNCTGADPFVDDYQPYVGVYAGTNTPSLDPGFVTNAMYLHVNTITNNNTQEELSIDWPANQTQSSTQMPSGLTLPSGEVVTFNWQPYQFRINDATPGIWRGYFTVYKVSPGGLSSETEVRKWAQAYGVHSVVEKDTDGTTRTTTYNRVVPTPIGDQSVNTWSSTDFYVATTYPDNSVMVETYWSPIQGSNGGPGSPMADQIQTLACLKHLVKEQRFYVPGVSWQSDRGSNPPVSTAYKIIQYGLVDPRRDGVPGESISFSCMPVPTTVTTWDLDSQINEVTTLTNWQGSPTYAWGSTKRVVTTQGGTPLYTAQADRTFAPLLQFGLYPRATSEVTTVSADTTGGLASSVPQNSSLPYKLIAYESTNPEFDRVASVTLVGNPEQIVTTPVYQASPSYINANRVQSFTTQAGSYFTGTTGVSQYGYDNYGRLNSIQPLGATWSVGQGEDELGRVVSQTDPNGVTTSYQWDGANRLTGITPISSMTPTGIQYPDSRGDIQTFGSQQSERRYNGFGDLVLTRRWNGQNVVSHKVYAYDPMGRKVFESVWMSGAGNDTDGQSNSTLIGDRWSYDPEGRLTDHTDPNGVVTHTAYSGLTRTVTIGFGSQSPIPTTYLSDAIGRLIQVTDALNQVTKYRYNAAGQILEVHQGGVGSTPEQVRRWEYNSLGWLTALVQPESGRTEYSSFTVLGKPMVTTYGVGSNPRTVVSQFDGLGRPTSIGGTDGSVLETLNYDEGGAAALANGKLTSAVTGAGVSRQLQYNGTGCLDGRLTSLTMSVDGFTWAQAMAYNPDGTLASRTYPDHSAPGALGQTESIGYESAIGRPNAVTWNAASLVSMVSYDPVHWMTNSITFGNSAASFYQYCSDQHMLKSTTHAIPTGPTRAWNYSYNGASLLSSDGEDYFYFDPIGRLQQAYVRDPWASGSLGGDQTVVPGDQGVVQTFGYDLFGNRFSLASLQVTSGWDAGTAPTSAVTTSSIASSIRDLRSYTMNASELSSMAASNQLPSTVGGVGTGALYDGQGNLTRIYRVPSDSTTELDMTYDSLARVTSMVDQKRGVTELYTYDDQGLRIKTEVYQWGALQSKKYMVYNEARQLIAEYDLVLQ